MECYSNVSDCYQRLHHEFETEFARRTRYIQELWITHSGMDKEAKQFQDEINKKYPEVITKIQAQHYNLNILLVPKTLGLSFF